MYNIHFSTSTDLIPSDEMKGGTYDYADHSVSANSERDFTEKASLSMVMDGGHTYEETGQDEAVGSEEQQSFYDLLGSSQSNSTEIVTSSKMTTTAPVYEDPSSSQCPV